MEDNNVNKETITLYNLKFEFKDEYFTKEEQHLAHKEENLNKNQYYKIEDKKLEELEKVFKQVKTNIKLGFNLKKCIENRETSRFLPEIIFDIKIDIKKKKAKLICIIYEGKNFSKKIEIKIPDIFKFVEKLDNKDLIFITFNRKNCKLLIYRFMQGQNNENKGYFLSQEILEPKIYDLFIKAISENRFFCVYNYEFKMYALNEKNEYELVLFEPYETIDFIYEIDTNKFIFGLYLRRFEGHGFCCESSTCHQNFIINKIELKDIDKIKNKSNNNNLKLKFSFISEKIYEFKFSGPIFCDKINFSDYVSLKNNYFIILVENNILIFNMETGKEIKRFKIKADGRSYLRADIKKWDCPENDEFILIVYNNVILIRLLNEENSSKISLNIINYGYFPELCYKETKERTIFKDLKKIKGQKNKFYSYTENCNDIFIY